MIVALFDKYGGAPSVTRIVRDFHERLMRLLFLRCYFEEMEVDKVTNITFNMFSIPFANQEFKMKKNALPAHAIWCDESFLQSDFRNLLFSSQAKARRTPTVMLRKRLFEHAI